MWSTVLSQLSLPSYWNFVEEYSQRRILRETGLSCLVSRGCGYRGSHHFQTGRGRKGHQKSTFFWNLLASRPALALSWAPQLHRCAEVQIGRGRGQAKVNPGLSRSVAQPIRSLFTPLKWSLTGIFLYLLTLMSWHWYGESNWKSPRPGSNFFDVENS